MAQDGQTGRYPPPCLPQGNSLCRLELLCHLSSKNPALANYFQVGWTAFCKYSRIYSRQLIHRDRFRPGGASIFNPHAAATGHVAPRMRHFARPYAQNLLGTSCPSPVPDENLVWRELQVITAYRPPRQNPHVERVAGSIHSTIIQTTDLQTNSQLPGSLLSNARPIRRHMYITSRSVLGRRNATPRMSGGNDRPLCLSMSLKSIITEFRFFSSTL